MLAVQVAKISDDSYRRRLVDGVLDELLEQLPALLVVGPRAAGKTTTLARRAATVVRLDVPTEAAAFDADPDAALRGLEEPVLLDEWQAVPGVLGAVRRAVDAGGGAGRFLITGSVRAELEHRVWPGTGRIVRLSMFPMTVRELTGGADGRNVLDAIASGEELAVPRDVPDLRGYVEFALRSGFPRAALELSGVPGQSWLESYVEDVLTHDVDLVEPQAGRRRDRQRLRRYFEAYALNSAGIVDDKAISETAEVNRATGDAYERLLSDLLVVEQVPAWSSNRLQRLAHRPKRYVIDPALIAAALRIGVDGVMRDGDLLGRILDTFVVAQLRPELARSAERPRLHHLRTKQGRQEVDLLAELSGRRLVGIEIKASAAPSARDAKHLAWLRDAYGERFVAGVVFHTGPRTFRLAERIQAVPIAALWG